MTNALKIIKITGCSRNNVKHARDVNAK